MTMAAVLANGRIITGLHDTPRLRQAVDSKVLEQAINDEGDATPVAHSPRGRSFTLADLLSCHCYGGRRCHNSPPRVGRRR